MVVTRMQTSLIGALGASTFLLVFTATNILLGQAVELDSLFTDNPVELSQEQGRVLANLAKVETTDSHA